MIREDFCGGSIEVICGPMFAGKSEELLRRINRLIFAKKHFLVFKPTIDDRYSETEVVSHTKRAYKAIPIKNSSELIAHVDDNVEVVCIDEVQFFDFGIVEVAEKLADRGIRVICAGLDTDFKGNPFEVSAALLARAEDVTKLTAICPICGKQATRTQRIVNGQPAYDDEPIVLVGATESYEPRCRKCHIVLKRIK